MTTNTPARRRATTTPARAKQPQDRKPKTEPEEDGAEYFEWTDSAGHTWTATKPLSDHVSPGIFRRNRDNDVKVAWEILEQVFEGQSGFFEVIDASWDDLNDCSAALFDAAQATFGASVGESDSSST